MALDRALGGTPARLAAPALALLALAGPQRPQHPSEVYYPTTDASWERRRPSEVGLDSLRLWEAIHWMEAEVAKDPPLPKTEQETIATQEKMLREVMHEPQPIVIGVVHVPPGLGGLVLRHGYIVAEFGKSKDVDANASLTKSILSIVAGVAFDRKLFASVDDSVYRYVHDGGYDSPHNRGITWRHHLTQTSEWEGELWGMTDVNDRRGDLRTRPVVEPGTRFGYNDVRVNRLALSLLRLFQQPLPEVLKKSVMDPIGASNTWSWHGYRNSTVKVAGRPIESVSGGAHWGGGFWTNSYDLARLGLLFSRGGVWNGRRLLSEEWIRMSTTPSAVNPDYGFLWWLNTSGRFGTKLPKTAYTMAGGGGFYCLVDPEHDIVVVLQNLGDTGKRPGGFLDRLMDAVL
jgi:CubicO group peptidase (beta-lactamase class C family)